MALQVKAFEGWQFIIDTAGVIHHLPTAETVVGMQAEAERLRAENERLRADRSGGCACRFDERTLPDGRIDLDAWVHKCAFHAALNAENERLTDELCKWRSAIQELTPGGSEFMSVDAVRNYAKMQKKETFDAHMGAAKARKELAQAEAQLAACVGFVEFVLRNAFEGNDLSGADIQDEALDFGLIRQVAYDPERHGPNDYDVRPGDQWFEGAFPTRARLLLGVVTAAEEVMDIVKQGDTKDAWNRAREWLHDALAAYHGTEK